jgi:hypothetical protein
MDGYREAMRQSDQLDLLNQAFIHHVVAVSVNEAYNRLVTRIDDAQTIAAETKEYAQEIAKNDRLAGVLSFSQAQLEKQLKKLLVGGGAIVFLITYLGVIISFFAGAGREVGSNIPSSAGMHLFRIFFVVGGVGVVVKYWHFVVEIFNIRTAAHEVLHNTIDGAEHQFFSLVGGTPPRRPTINIIGPAAALILIIIGVIIGLVVINLFLGIFSPRPR